MELDAFNPKIIQFFKENLFQSRQPMTSGSAFKLRRVDLNLRKPTACRNTCDRLPNPNILVTYKASDLKKDWWDSKSVKKHLEDLISNGDFLMRG